jgi:acyl-CoA thioesterase FadM
MNRWLRTLITFIRAQFRKKINPDEETSLSFRVWISDVDLSIMNNAAMLTIMEMGRIDLIIRTGFLIHAWKNRLYLPLASISAQFRRPLKRFQKFQLKTQLIYWDEKWIYISHRVVREGKTIAVALVKSTLKKGKELIPFGKIINELNWQLKPKNRPEMIDRFERGESLFLEDCKARFSD